MRPPRSKKTPVIIVVTGLLIIVVTVIGLAVSIRLVTSSTPSLTAVNAHGSVTVTLDAHALYGLYSTDYADAYCAITDPSGQRLLQGSTSQTTRVNGYRLVSTFLTLKDGDYVITCDAPEATPIFVGQALNSSTLTRTVIGCVASGIALTVGVVVLIVGTVWCIVRHLRNRAQAPYPAGAPGPRM